MIINRTTVLAVILLLCGTLAYADECNSLRYSDNGNGTVTDCRTGLIWLKNANCTDSLAGIDRSSGNLIWNDAMTWVAALRSGYCGLTDGSADGDWRLPTKTELMAMVESAKKQGITNPALTDATGTTKWTDGNIFNNVVSPGHYWSSTTVVNDAAFAWFVNMYTGAVSNFIKNNSVQIWPVRGGQSGEFGNVIIQ